MYVAPTRQFAGSVVSHLGIYRTMQAPRMGLMAAGRMRIGRGWVPQASHALYNGTLRSIDVDTSQLCWHACVSTPRCKAWCAWSALCVRHWTTSNLQRCCKMNLSMAKAIKLFDTSTKSMISGQRQHQLQLWQTSHRHMRRYWCDSVGRCTDSDGRRYLGHECRLFADASIPALPPAAWQPPQFAAGYQTGQAWQLVVSS